jgi:hypothetical protein
MEQVVFVADLHNELESKVIRADVFDGMRSARGEFEVTTTQTAKGSFIGLILVSIGAGLVVLAFVFTIKSLWLATHPNFDLTLPKLPSFSAINAGQFGNGVKNPQGSKPVENIEVPPVSEGYTEVAIEDFLSQVSAKENVLADSTPKQALVDMGVQVCTGIDKGFTEEEIINDFVLKIANKYPNILDAESFGQAIFDSASLTLCLKEDPDLT